MVHGTPLTTTATHYFSLASPKLRLRLEGERRGPIEEDKIQIAVPLQTEVWAAHECFCGSKADCNDWRWFQSVWQTVYKAGEAKGSQSAEAEASRWCQGKCFKHEAPCCQWICAQRATVEAWAFCQAAVSQKKKDLKELNNLKRTSHAILT